MSCEEQEKAPGRSGALLLPGFVVLQRWDAQCESVVTGISRPTLAKIAVSEAKIFESNAHENQLNELVIVM